ncbi:MAG: hypothetical protein A2V83_03740 [Nitrospirae bacterium RBG_16_64_22]|nr:MAG: hypothetical protein A2V83_03740 [Nitrospirae bacterium RBG_16_64_22]
MIRRLSRAIPILACLSACLPLAASHTAAAKEASAASSVVNPQALLFKMEEAYNHIQSYRAVVLSRERVGGVLQPEDKTLFEFKKPFELFMTWLDGPKKGNRLYFRTGWNEDRIRLRQAGILGAIPINLDPASSLLKNGTNHTIREAGLGFFIQTMTSNARRAQAAGILEIRPLGKQTVEGRPVQAFDVHIGSRPGNGYYCRRLLVDIDAEIPLPIRFTTFDWDGNIVEQFVYRDLTLNPPLQDLERKI